MDRTEPGNNFARTQLRVCKYLQGSAIPANIERHLFLHRHRRHDQNQNLTQEAVGWPGCCCGGADGDGRSAAEVDEDHDDDDDYGDNDYLMVTMV